MIWKWYQRRVNLIQNKIKLTRSERYQSLFEKSILIRIINVLFLVRKFARKFVHVEKLLYWFHIILKTHLHFPMHFTITHSSFQPKFPSFVFQEILVQFIANAKCCCAVLNNLFQCKTSLCTSFYIHYFITYFKVWCFLYNERLHKVIRIILKSAVTLHYIKIIIKFTATRLTWSWNLAHFNNNLRCCAQFVTTL